MNLTKTISKVALRPAMQLAILMNGYFVATDAHSMAVIKADTVPHFDMLTDNKVFDVEALKVIAKAKKIRFDNGSFIADGISYQYTGSIDPATREISMDETRSRIKADGAYYPDYTAVLAAPGTFEMPKMGLNAKLLAELQNAFIGKPKGVKLEFTASVEGRAYRVTPIVDAEFKCIEQYGIIMPMMILG